MKNSITSLRALEIILMASFIACSISAGQSPTASETGIEGTIGISPSHPGPTREDEADSAPLANITFAAENESGTATTFTTDEKGRFRVSLKPGHYRVSVKEQKNRIRRCGPFDVDVGVNKMTKVEWRCDSGMR